MRINPLAIVAVSVSSTVAMALIWHTAAPLLANVLNIVALGCAWESHRRAKRSGAAAG